MISGFVMGQDKVVGRFRLMSPRIMGEMAKTTEALAITLSAYVQRNKLSGQILKNRTGKLRRSINYKVTNTPDSSRGTVGTNTEYAAAHEYGFHGTVTVKEHLRQIKMAWGKSIVPKEITVRAHSANMNIPEASFLRSSLKDNADKIKSEYYKAMQRGIA